MKESCPLISVVFSINYMELINCGLKPIFENPKGNLEVQKSEKYKLYMSYPNHIKVKTTQ